ncbi:MAG: hypothetical protein QUV05_12315, partial [Phycisphaerae bacterium]|nr:hypothetical protein [Phycisphaerae bacterium]
MKYFSVVFTLCLLLAGNVLGGQPPTTPAPSGRSIGEFLTPDGRFDLDAARRSGYEGPLDIEGIESRIDPATGELNFQAAFPASSADHPDDIYWDNTISPCVPGVGWSVPALTAYDGKLIAGGVFTTAGGVAASRVASWDGSSWSPLGSGMSADGTVYVCVYALTVYDGKLIAGGYFTTAGGVPANCIASWDGSSWSSLGSGMSSDGYVYVWALTVYDGKLIAGGFFTTAGGVAANNIASWDGSSWSPLGSGMNDEVYALTVYDGKLIAGGWFTLAGGVAANFIASWDGISWSPLGSGMSGRVDALTVYDGQLIAGGDFTTAGDVAANCIASWDGSSWSPLGSGMNDEVYALTVYDGKLIAGGWFTLA